MSAQNQVTILGSGTSTGIPILGCNCVVCQSDDTRDKRLRSSIFLHTKADQKILIDTTPDLRTQLLRDDILDVDSCVITHQHADHCHGIDDLRPINFMQKKTIPIYTSKQCADDLKNKFDYIFNGKTPEVGGGIPKLTLSVVKPFQETMIGSDKFVFFELPHGYVKTLGFVHNDSFAYFIDCKVLPPEVLKYLDNLELELMILDCVKPYPHSTHLHYQQSMEYAQRIKAKKTRLIHMSHDFKHEVLAETCKRDSKLDIAPCADREVYFY